MKDILFFPLILLAGAGLVVLALLPAGSLQPSSAISCGGTACNLITVQGEDLQRIVAGGRADISVEDRGDDDWVLTLTADAGMLPGDPARGPHFRLAPDVETAFAGHTIQVTIAARHPSDKAAPALEVNYSAGLQGESGWQAFPLTSQFKNYQFSWDVPVRSGDQAVDYLGLRPVVPEKTRAVEIRSISFRRTGRIHRGEGQ